MQRARSCSATGLSAMDVSSRVAGGLVLQRLKHARCTVPSSLAPVQSIALSFLRGKKNAPLDTSDKERRATQQHAKDDPALRTPRLALATAKLLPYSAGEGGRTGSESIENRIDRMALLAADHGGAARARTFLGCSSLLRTGPIVAVVCHTIDPLLFFFKRKIEEM